MRLSPIVGEIDRDSNESDKPLIKRLLALMLKYHWRCIWVVVLHVLLLTIGLAGLSAAGIGVDVIRYRDNIGQVPLPFGIHPPQSWSVMRILFAMGGFILLVSVIRIGLTYYSQMTSARLIQDMMIRLRADIYDKLQRLGFHFYDNHLSGGIINRVTSDVQLVRMFMDQVIIEGITLVLMLVISLVYMIHIHPVLTLACLATTPILAAATVAYTRIVRPAMMKSRQLHDDLILALSENVQGVHVVKGFVREQPEIARFSATGVEVRDQQTWVFRMSSFYNVSAGMLSFLNTMVLVGYGGYLVMHGQLALGSGLLVFYGLLGQFSNQVANLAAIANTLQMSLTGARRVFEVLDTPIEISSAPSAVRIKKARGEVEFDRVVFGYLPGQTILANVSFKVKPGQCIAIVGPTGVGKSTLLSLIPRFYDPQRGRILVDGQDVRELHLDDLRRNIGIVFQETFLFSNTVSANIAFGNPDATPEQIARAARVAAAHDFISALPKKYETVVGERGIGLSGGQRQRLALARAVLLEPAILLLDDPTAAVDPQTEDEIQTALENVMAGRTTFIVSHRISTLRRADRIIVLDKGKIVQTGTHDELVDQPGHYRDMATIQFNYGATEQPAGPPANYGGAL